MTTIKPKQNGCYYGKYRRSGIIQFWCHIQRSQGLGHGADFTTLGTLGN